jgi:hypothetical protein
MLPLHKNTHRAFPTRIIIDEPNIKPESATVKFWKEWSTETSKQDIAKAVSGLRKQSKS